MKGAGIILLNSNNEVLLILRDNKPGIPYPDMWDIPGGQIENDETPDETIRREMNEELGIKNLTEIKLFNIFTSENITDYIYWKRIDLDPDEINLTEGQRIEYFSIERIKQTKLAFGYNHILENFFQKLKSND